MNNKTSHNNLVHFGDVKLALPILITSLLFLLLFWCGVIIAEDLACSFESLISIHQSIATWVIDLFLLLLPPAYYLLSRRIAQLKEEKDAYLKQTEERIAEYTRHAENLGMDNYESPIIPKDENDELGNALKYLQGYLRATSRKERQRRWVLEGKDVISKILRLYNSFEELSWHVLNKLCDFVNVEQGAVYLYFEEEEILRCISTYAYNKRKYVNQEFRLGYGLVGQCALEMDFIYRTEIPEDYITISSGILGEQRPKSLVIIPLISDDKLQGVIEFAGIQPKIPKNSIQFLLEMGEIIARTFYNLKINQRTERLLRESIKMTLELKANEKTLKENASVMKKTQEELEISNQQLEAKIKEVQNAREKLHWLLENASELITIYDAGLRLSYVSPSVRNILGYTEEEYKNGLDLECLSKEGAEAFSSLLKDPGNQKSIQYAFRKKNGDTIYLESSAKNLLHDPSVNGIIINSRDITESIRASREEMLKTRMQSLSENSIDLILRISIQGEFHYANPVVEDYTGMKPEFIIKKKLSELPFLPELKDYLQRILSSIKLNPVKSREEVSISIKLGGKISERIIRFDAIPEYSRNELETILLVGHDITEAKRIEKELQEKNKNIQDSINYSKKIQSAILPYPETLNNAFPGSFMLYKPREVISGDFPWYFRDDDFIYLAAVDCTGHGIPGSMLSFIAYFLLNDVVKKSSSLNAGEVCDQLHDLFRITLKQDNDKSDSRDGLDIALVKIRSDFKKIEFAGAHRPLYLLRGKELMEFKGNRKAIGGLELFKKADEKFLNYTIEISPGDKIFFFTDGLTDQLGGPYGRKYTPNRVKNHIQENHEFTMEKFKELFEHDFSEWMKDFRQLDDVLMIGIEF